MAFQMTKEQAEAHQRKHGFLRESREVNPMPLAKKLLPGSRMNKTEAEYALILEAIKRRGEILRYEYEGVTLRWGGLRYTPDFVVVKAIPIECESCGKTHTRMQTYLRFIEVKGARIWDDAMVKFKAARAQWPCFAFELHQKKGGQWQRLM